LDLIKNSILIIDDEVEHAVLLGFLLTERGFETDLAYSAEEAFEKIKKSKFDYVISDIRMPVMSGPELFEEVKKNLEIIPRFVFVTGFSDLSEEEAESVGVLKIFKKPVDPEKIAKFLNEHASRSI
jgi:CheY-like chemotaxis protein